MTCKLLLQLVFPDHLFSPQLYIYIYIFTHCLPVSGDESPELVGLQTDEQPPRASLMEYTSDRFGVQLYNDAMMLMSERAID